MVKLERKRSELEHARRAQTPGSPEYATGAIKDLWPTPAHFVSQLGIPGASDVAEYQAARSEGLGVLPALGLAALPFGIGYGVKGGLKAVEPMLRGGPELPGVNPEMAALQAALGSDPAMQTRMFMGQWANNANVEQLGEAEKLASGGADAADIWKQTGWWVKTDKGPNPPGGAPRWEVAEPQTFRYEGGPMPQVPSKLSTRLKHPQLYANYPEVGEIPTSTDPMSESKGHFIPGRVASGSIGDIAIADDLAAGADRTSVAVHEAQHATQHAENRIAEDFNFPEGRFSSGGLPQSAHARIVAQLREDRQAASTGKMAYDVLSKEISNWRRAEYLDDLDRMVKKPPRTPYQLKRASPWYQHGKAIQEEIGPPPKKAGPLRDDWVQQAAILYRLNERSAMQKRLLNFEFNEAERILDASRQGYLPKPKNKLRTLERKQAKHIPDARAYANADDLAQRLFKLSDYDQYLRLGGEAEARAAQNRLGLTHVERRNRAPWLDYDVPMEDIIR